MVEEFKVEKCKAVVMYRDSTDGKVQGTHVTTRSGCKWAADTSSLLKLKNIIRNQRLGHWDPFHPFPTVGESRHKKGKHDLSRGPA